MSKEANREKVDVVIVGGGASGLLLAAKLSEAGKKVVVIEQGPAFQLDDMISSDIWSRRLKWGGPPVLSEGQNPLGYNFSSGWGVGGATLHHFGTWLRLHPEDFRMKSLYGRGLDWPISYEELRPYYDRIQREVGLSGDHVAETWRPAGDPYPMPALKSFRHARRLAEGFKKFGISTAPCPAAINSVEYNNRSACIYDGWCNAGCPIGALANPLVTYLPKAVKAGAEIRSQCSVTRVLVNARGDRATGVEYYDSQKQLQVQTADVVTLAAFAAHNPRILFNSATDKHPNGLANSGGLVGRYIMSHHMATFWGLFDEDVENHMGLSGALLISQDDYAKNRRKEAFGSYMWLIGVSQKPNDILGSANSRTDIFGTALHDFMKKAARGLAKFQSQGEGVPNPENRVVLADRKDEFGLPLARIIHAMDENTTKLFNHEAELGLRIMQMTSAKQAWAKPTPDFAHICGGTVMGKTVADSVTDSYGRTHDIANLFIAGTGLFPTEGAVNPTFTLHALTLRTADYMAANWDAI
jgi:choline dehydrogenase-like flavoprotein